MRFNHTFIIAFGMLWVVQSCEAQAPNVPADPATVAPQEPVRVGPPPKRGAAPVREVNTQDGTKNNGKVAFSAKAFDFGTFKKGQPQTRELVLTNTSKETLTILKVKTSCHCTSTTYKETPVPPGGTTTIQIHHNAEDLGDFMRIVSIQTNFDPEAWVMISVDGKVVE